MGMNKADWLSQLRL